MSSSAFSAPLAGGVLIGLSAVLLLLFNGRIAGISGMLRGLLERPGVLHLQRLLFLGGLVAGVALYQALYGHRPEPRPEFPPLLLAAAGLLVGYGTALGRGCTSGHGVCGLARLSPRSVAAVAIFLGVGMLTTWVVRHLLGVA